jgi:hypothetical protein
MKLRFIRSCGIINLVKYRFSQKPADITKKYYQILGVSQNASET